MKIIKEKIEELKTLAKAEGVSMYCVFTDGEQTAIAIVGDGKHIVESLSIALSEDDDSKRLITAGLIMSKLVKRKEDAPVN